MTTDIVVVKEPIRETVEIIARGPQGPPGEASEGPGSEGPPGPEGPQGPQGPKGDAGSQGAPGADGSDGATGPEGPKGAKGDAGSTGPEGPKGSTGEKGAKGDTGAAGSQGIQGEKGATGAAGPEGPKGSTGATGPEGPAGVKGDTGAAGAQGVKGDTGATGAKGETGATGAKGADGLSPTLAVVAADVALNKESTALQNVTGLSLAIGAPATEIWRVSYWLLVSAANATMDTKFGFTVPAGCTMQWGGLVGNGLTAVPGFGGTTTANSPLALKGAGETISVGSFNGVMGIALTAIVFGGGNAGNVQLQCAQNLSDAGALKVLKGSVMEALKVAS